MVIISSHDEFAAFLGKEIGVSPWLRITQEQINHFADATLDHQWIHTDPERAAKESPFKKTIAHGYLTLSVVPYLWQQITEIRNFKMQINYGIENLKFAQPVLADSEIRLRVKVASILNLRGVSKITISSTMEIKDADKPAFTADMVFLYHFM